MKALSAFERLVYAVADRWPAGAFCLFVRFFLLGVAVGAAAASLAWWGFAC